MCTADAVRFLSDLAAAAEHRRSSVRPLSGLNPEFKRWLSSAKARSVVGYLSEDLLDEIALLVAQRYALVTDG